jgi:ankyrin repeat protein
MILDKAEYKELQDKYVHCINYESDDIDDPIDPFMYVDSNGDNCLHIAAYSSDLRAIELLIKGGIDINSLGDMEQTALAYAKRKGDEEVVNFLIQNGAK